MLVNWDWYSQFAWLDSVWVECLRRNWSRVRSGYGVQSGTEMDMVVETSRGLVGFEFKAGPVPARTRSMLESIQDIGLRQVFVIHPGERRFDLGEKIEAVPIRQLATLRGEVQ